MNVSVSFDIYGLTLEDIQQQAINVLAALAGPDITGWTIDMDLRPNAENGEGKVVLWHAEVTAVRPVASPPRTVFRVPV